jgi:hypothetical protein
MMYEVLKPMQTDVAALKEGQRETNAALNAIRIHMVGMQQDIQKHLLDPHAPRNKARPHRAKARDR